MTEIELPRIAVAIEKTRQLAQFEPVKVFVSLSESVEKITPEKIREMIRTAEMEVDIKLGSLEAREERSQRQVHAYPVQDRVRSWHGGAWHGEARQGEARQGV